MRVAGTVGGAQVKIQYDDRGEGIPVEYHVSFCGYFPADKPRYSMIVSLNKQGLPASGGGMAGVVFHSVAEWIATHPEVFKE
jgi:cell division protein FtsI (penicillin-binding protein 3)